MSTKRVRLLTVRIFAGLMLLVCFGNGLPPLIVLSQSSSEYYMMDCCKGKVLHLMGSCSGEACHLKSAQKKIPKKPDCHFQTETVEPAHEEKLEIMLADPSSADVPIFGAEGHTNSHDKNLLPTLKIKFIERCGETVLRAGNGSNSGHRQQQSSENSVLFSFADVSCPPLVVSLDFNIQVGFQFTRQILSRQSHSRAPPVCIS
jgi:hypothetical protein